MTLPDLGSDCSSFAGPGGTFGVDPTFGVITGTRVVAEAIARRLLTTRGWLPEDPTYGSDVRAALSDGFSPSRLGALGASIENEATADERVLSATAAVTFNAPSQSLAISVRFITAAGPFDLVLTVSAARVVLATQGT